RSGAPMRAGRTLLLTVALGLPLAACGSTVRSAAADPIPSSAPSVVAVTSAAPTTAAPAGNTPSGFGVRAAHITSFGWAEPSLRDPILELVKEKKLDA